MGEVEETPWLAELVKAVRERDALFSLAYLEQLKESPGAVSEPGTHLLRQKALVDLLGPSVQIPRRT